MPANAGSVNLDLRKEAYMHYTTVVYLLLSPHCGSSVMQHWDSATMPGQ